MKILFVVEVVLLSFMFGCAHSTMRGSVAMKATDDELHVCMGEKEVKTGDRVAFFINQCRDLSGVKAGTGRDICTKIKIGEGIVVRSLNEHYSVVKPDMGVGAKIGEKTIVEKL